MSNKIFDGIAMTVGLLLVLLVVAAKGPVLMGSDTLVVIGGSMEPAIGLGSAVVVQPVDAGSLGTGDVISYVGRSNVLVTHRIIEVVKDAKGLGFRTQGDANATPDPELVRPVNLVGQVWYSVPFAGYLLHHVAQPIAKMAAMGAIVALLAAQFLLGQSQRSRPQLAAVEAS